MPVDPTIKQDLMLVKEHFERKALDEEGNAALVPTAEILRSQRDVHVAVRDEMYKYPASYAADLQEDSSFINKLQQECIPCLNRIESLKDCDISPRLDKSLINYNININTQLTQMFSNLNGRNPIEENLCEIYKAYKSQCVPDISRAIAALSYLISSLRGFDLKLLQDNFIQVVLGLIANLVFNVTFNLDKFAQLITDTLRCIVADIQTQLKKLNPIISVQGRDNARRQIADAWNQTSPVQRDIQALKNDLIRVYPNLTSEELDAYAWDVYRKQQRGILERQDLSILDDNGAEILKDRPRSQHVADYDLYERVPSKDTQFGDEFDTINQQIDKIEDFLSGSSVNNLSDTEKQKLRRILTDLKKRDPDLDRQERMQLAMGIIKDTSDSLDAQMQHAILDPLNRAIAQVNSDLVNGAQNISKLFSAGESNLQKLNELIQMVQIVQGVLGVLNGLINSLGDDSYNPCGEDDEYNRARRFFNRVKLPGSKVVVTPGANTDDPDDVDIVVVKDPIQVTNPIVEDILRSRGATIIDGDNEQKFVDANSISGGPAGNISFSLFACLGSSNTEEE